MDKAFLAEYTYILACNLWFCARQSSMTIVKYNTRVVSTIVSKIFKLANTEIFIFAYGQEFWQFLRMIHILLV